MPDAAKVLENSLPFSLSDAPALTSLPVFVYRPDEDLVVWGLYHQQDWKLCCWLEKKKKKEGKKRRGGKALMRIQSLAQKRQRPD